MDIASKGGNYLLNVGPTSEGLIPPPSVERLKAIGAWMKANGEAIYGTTASPFTALPWGRCTKKVQGDETTLYLHVFDWPTNGTLVVPGLKNEVEQAYVLKKNWLGNQRQLKTAKDPEGVLIFVPGTGPDKISSTIVLRIKGAPNIAPTPVAQAANGSVHLSDTRYLPVGCVPLTAQPVVEN